MGTLGGLLYATFAPKIYQAQVAVSAISGATNSHAPQEAVMMLMNQQSVIQSAAQKSNFDLRKWSNSVQINAGGSSNLVNVLVNSGDPEVASIMANQIVSQYKKTASAANSALRTSTRKDLAAKEIAAHAKLLRVRNRIALIEKNSGILDIKSKVQHLADYEETLSQQKDQSSTELNGLQSQINDEKTKLAKLPRTTQSNVIETANPIIAQYQSQLQTLQAKRISLLETWLETAPIVQGVEVQIAAVKKEMSDARIPALSVSSKQTDVNPQRLGLEKQLASDESQAANLQATLSAIANTSASQKQKAIGLPVAQSVMEDLIQQQTMAESNYQTIANQIDNLDLVGAPGESPEISTFMPATTPTVPMWPKESTALAIGSAIGLLLGILVGIGLWPRRAYTVAPLQPIYSNSLAASDVSELPSRTSVPPLPSRKKDGLVQLALPGSSPAEAYRFMVFSLQARSMEAERTILFTGVSSDNICSEAAAQFAIAMSQTGMKTLLADCNLRHKALTNAFGFNGKSGVSDVLSRTMLPTPSSDLLLETAHPGLYFLPCGSEESEGLASYQNPQIRGLVEDFQTRAEVKVINAAPCTIVADAPRLVRYVDDVCLVASINDEQRGLVDKAKSILKLAGAEKVELIIVDGKEAKQSFLG